MPVNDLCERKTVPSESDLVSLLDAWGIIVDRVETANENIVDKCHIYAESRNMVLQELEVQVL